MTSCINCFLCERDGESLAKLRLLPSLSLSCGFCGHRPKGLDQLAACCCKSHLPSSHPPSPQLCLPDGIRPVHTPSLRCSPTTWTCCSPAGSLHRKPRAVLERFQTRGHPLPGCLSLASFSIPQHSLCCPLTLRGSATFQAPPPHSHLRMSRPAACTNLSSAQ